MPVTKQFNFRIAATDVEQFRTDMQKVAASSAEADAALKGLAHSSPTFASLLDGVQVTVRQTADSLKQGKDSADRMRFAMRDLGTQSIDLFQGIATGQPIMRTLLQQGAQVAQVNASMGISTREFAAAIASRLLSPLGLAVTGLTAFGAAAYLVVNRIGDLDTHQRALTTSIAVVGKTAELSSHQLGRYVDALRAQGLTREDATGVVASLARNPALSGAQIGRIAALVPDAAVAMNTDQLSAAKQLADVATGAAAAIKKLDDEYNLLTPNQRAAVQTMLDHNEALKAGNVILSEAETRWHDLRQNSLSPSEKALQNLKSGWEGFVSSVISSKQATEVIDFYAGALRRLSSAMEGVTVGSLNEQRAGLNKEIVNLQRQLAQGDGEDPRVQNVARQMLAQRQAQFDALTAQIKQMQATTASSPTESAYGPPVPDDLAATAAMSKAVLDTAFSRVGGTQAGQIEKYRTEIGKFRVELERLGPRTSDNADRFDTLTAAIAANGKSIDDLLKKNEVHASSTQKQAATLEAQIAAQKQLIVAYGQGSDAVAQVLARQAAEKQLISDGILPTSKAYNAALTERTALYLKLNGLTAEADVAKQTAANQNQLDYIQAEVSSLGMENDARALMLAHLKAELDLKIRGVSLESTVAQGYLATSDAITAATVRLQHMQQSMQALTGIADAVFDQVGQAITNGLVQGAKGAVSAGSIINGVIASISSNLLKLGVINPLLNGLIGADRPTLTSAVNDLASSGGGGLLGAAIRGIGGWFGGGSSTGAAVGAVEPITGFMAGGMSLLAHGGVMTPYGQVPLRRYGGGGVARSPQMAIYGEGDTPEAFVPLPDGRSIPVTMRGGGGQMIRQGDIHLHFANSNLSPAFIGAVVESAANRANAQLLADIDRGGATAKIVGRRRK